MFDCEAYGSEGTEMGVLCFQSPVSGKRVCGSREECEQVMTSQRQRVFRRIQELSAAGGPEWEFLEQAFTSPEQLLGSDRDDDD